MKNLSKSISSSIENSVSWILPVGLIVITFIVLFFGISEQVGGLKSLSANLYYKVGALNEELDKLKNEESNVVTNQNVTFSKELNTYKELKIAKETIDLTKETYWGYVFKTVKSLEKSEIVNKDNIYIVNYTTKDQNNEETLFKLLKLNDDSKSVSVDNKIYNKVLVFLDGKLVFFNDFTENKKDNLKDTLNNAKTIENLSEQLTLGIEEELKNL